VHKTLPSQKVATCGFRLIHVIEIKENKMAIILNIEASTDVCSVALSESGEVFFYQESSESRSHAQVLAPFVEEAIATADSRAMKIDAVALSCGPGSYTGLRIASSTAKGVCYGREIPLIAIPTTQIMAVPVLFRDDIPDDALLCPMIDARRTEVYATIYDRALNVQMATRAEVVTPDSFAEYLDKQPVYFFGDGAAKCSTIITHPNARFLDKYRNPLAKWMMPLAERAWLDGKFEQIAYFEPFYLKNFVATKSKDLLKTT
jgi:tRNA threonylcarbamoyladenosine biosynthesis protein TsaB